MQRNSKKRAAVPSFLALVDEKDKLLFRSDCVKAEKFPDVVVRSDLVIANIHKYALKRHSQFRKRLFHDRLDVFRQLSYVARKNRQLRQHPLHAALAVCRPEVLDHDFDELL